VTLRMLEAVRNVQWTRARRALMAQSAVRCAPANISVEGIPEPDGLRVNVEYKMGCAPGGDHGQPLVFNLARCPFILEDVVCSSARNAEETKGLLIFHLEPGATWESAQITFSLRLRHHSSANGESAVLQVPDLLPTPAIEEVGCEGCSATLPKVQLYLDELAFDPERADFATPAGHEDDIERVTLVASLIPRLQEGESLEVDGHPGLRTRFSDAVLRITDEDWRVVAKGVVAAAGDYFVAVNGVRIQADALVVLDEELGVAGSLDLPGIIHLSREQISASQSNQSQIVAELVRQLGRLWWGGYCRITGALGPTIEAGLVAGQTLAYLHDAGQNGARDVVSSLEQGAQTGMLEAFWAIRRGLMPTGISAQVALAARKFFLRSHGEWRRFGELVRPLWGAYSDSKAVLELMGSAGIGVPYRRWNLALPYLG